MQNLALLTDLYQLTMAYGYFKSNRAERRAVYHLNFRKRPFGGTYALAAGLQTVIDFLQEFRYSESDLHYLSQLKIQNKSLFDVDFLHYLSKMKLAVTVDAIEEGRVVFPYEPLLRVEGPLLQAQLLETPLLNMINFQTLIATKAARVVQSAYPDKVIEFGVRRAQGVDGALSASRAAFIGGCSSTSNVLAGKLYGIPVRGTQAHSWVMAFDREEEAFETFSDIFPYNTFILIDTYNSIEGAKKAIQVGKNLKEKGFSLLGVRLDSGDLAQLSIEVRKLLDQEGLIDVEIMASNELDEYLIRDLKQQGAKITIWGVGTNLVTAKEQPALDGVYKLSALTDEKGRWQNKIKISEQTAKITIPGVLQVRRFKDKKGFIGDLIYDVNHPPKKWVGMDMLDVAQEKTFDKENSEDLLVPILREGKCVYEKKELHVIRKRAEEDLSHLKPAVKRFLNPEPYFSGLEKNLFATRLELIKKMRLLS